MSVFYYVYILKCIDGSYYVGHTSDPDRRAYEHNDGNAKCSYTSKRRPVKMVYLEGFPNRATAFLFERKIKNWNRKKKEALIGKRHSDLIKLSKKTF